MKEKDTNKEKFKTAKEFNGMTPEQIENICKPRKYVSMDEYSKRKPVLKDSELKTLKDLKYPMRWIDNKPTNFCVNVKDLRKAAIEWIRHIEQDIEDWKRQEAETPLEDMYKFKFAMHGFKDMFRGQIMFIKRFFNIKEKDLK